MKGVILMRKILLNDIYYIVPINKMRTKNDFGDFYDNYIIALDVD